MSISDFSSGFRELGLDATPVLKALEAAGYTAPTPIQLKTIPHMMSGSDVIGQAQTGTGKTAAFALPLLCRLDRRGSRPQVLVLAPTRELAIQVAEAFQGYARFMRDVNILPLYGGQAYDHQLRQLRRGVQIVVGTPGRVMDHIRRGTLKLDGLRTLVLDEADEMLRMGFINDVEWILQHTPETRQTALFSATMPNAIRQVARRHLRQPEEIRIAGQAETAVNIRQRYWQVNGIRKLDALTRILEVEDFEAVLIFVRTRAATVELAQRLSARGYACEALNGDVPQRSRERTVERLKRGNVAILVATDVAARGLDVERISHVVNYDIPHDTEAYIHRIGRTGRAGRSGEAILFVTSGERRMLRTIERATRQPIEPMRLPSATDVNQKRVADFKRRIGRVLAGNRNLEDFYRLVTEYQREHGDDPLRIAAALAVLVQGDEPMFLTEKRLERSHSSGATDYRKPGRGKNRASGESRSDQSRVKVRMEQFRLEVGGLHGIKKGNIVGAIANEANIESCYIGQIRIFDTFTTVYLPTGMPDETLYILKRARVLGHRLDIKRQKKNRENPARGTRRIRAGSTPRNKKAKRRKIAFSS